MTTRRRRQAQATQLGVSAEDLDRIRRGVALVQLVRVRQLERCLWRLMCHFKERELFWLAVLEKRS